MIDRILEIYEDEEFIILDGLNGAIIGICDNRMVLIYSVSKCIELLTESIGNEFDAMEYFEFNIKGAFLGDKTPIFCIDNL